MMLVIAHAPCHSLGPRRRLEIQQDQETFRDLCYAPRPLWVLCGPSWVVRRPGDSLDLAGSSIRADPPNQDLVQSALDKGCFSPLSPHALRFSQRLHSVIVREPRVSPACRHAIRTLRLANCRIANCRSELSPREKMPRGLPNKKLVCSCSQRVVDSVCLAVGTGWIHSSRTRVIFFCSTPFSKSLRTNRTVPLAGLH